MKRRTLDELYNEYKNRNDKIITLEGKKYFKIIEVSRIAGFTVIVLPNVALEGKGNTFQDEKGNIFHVGSPAHYSFKEKIPEWYLETVSLIVKDINRDELGDYVRKI